MSTATTHAVPRKAGRRLGVLLALSAGAHLLILTLSHSPTLIPFDNPDTVLNINLIETTAETTTPTSEEKQANAQAEPPRPRAPERKTEKKTVANAATPTPPPAPTKSLPATSAAPQPPAQKPANQVKALLLARLRSSMNETFKYPLLARKRGWEGEVQLDIEVAANGTIANITIRQSSGHKLLDKSALDTLARIGQIADAIDWLSGRSLNVTLPVIYRLTSS